MILLRNRDSYINEGGSKMQTRKPVAAGRFYPGSQDACLAELAECLGERSLPANLPETIIAGIVPHAGWAYSGALAALVFAAVKKQNKSVDTFVIFGAAHRYYGEPAVYDKGAWQTPLGEITIDEELARDVLQSGSGISELRAHSVEINSIEVQIPFIQHLFADAKILPILTPPAQISVQLGDSLGAIAKESGKKIVFIGSTDLTHYGPGYGFTPKGDSEKGIEWAHKVNDAEFINFVLQMQPDKILDTAERNYNACGAGAAAAAVAAAKQLGKNKGILLAHTNSNTIIAQKMGSGSSESVGYAAIVF